MIDDTSNINRIGQGKKVDDRIEKTITEAMISIWMRGGRKRQLSAESILHRILEEHPDLIDALPSPQTVRRMMKPIKDRLEEMPGDLEKPWSLGTPVSGTDGIDDEALPLLLSINKAMALDVGEERRRSGFKSNRLTVGEARWVSRLRRCLPIDETGDRSVVSELETRVLADSARRYAGRELAAYIEGSELDTYDLDMEIAFNAVFPHLDQNGFSLLALSAELGLVPPAGFPTSVEIALNPQDESDGMPSSDGGFRIEDLREQATKAFVLNAITRLRERGTPLKVHFATEDWDDGGWFKYRSFSTSIDYEITFEVLRLIWPLERLDREVTVEDPRQVRIATAFAKKIVAEARKAMPDPSNTSQEQ
jgi:hypothetical protein